MMKSRRRGGCGGSSPRKPAQIKRIGVSLAAVGVLAAACGHPLIPAADLKPPAKIVRPPAPYLSAPIGPYTVKPPMLGVDLYAPRNYSQTQTFIYGVRTISYIKNVLQAKAIGIVWDYYSPSRTANVVQSTSAGTLTAADVMTLTRIAERYGLRVEYRPLIFIPSHKNNPWEGMLKPTNEQKFFSNYFSALWPYIKAAQKLHVSEFVTATEMHQLNGSRLWKKFFRRVGRIFHGVVSYTAFFRDYFVPTGHLLPVRLYGMDMYKALPLKATATQAQVTAAWEAQFKNVPAAVLMRTALDEEGIAARTGAYQLPPNLGAPGHLNQAVQARWFTAACRTVAHYHMRAVYFFKVNLADNPVEPSKALSVFEGREGAVAISACAKLFG